MAIFTFAEVAKKISQEYSTGITRAQSGIKVCISNHNNAGKTYFKITTFTTLTKRSTLTKLFYRLFFQSSLTAKGRIRCGLEKE